MTSIMNNKYNIKETHNVSEASSFEDRKIKSGLKTSTLRNNKTMNNKYRITIRTLQTKYQQDLRRDLAHAQVDMFVRKITGLNIARLEITKLTSTQLLLKVTPSKHQQEHYIEPVAMFVRN